LTPGWTSGLQHAFGAPALRLTAIDGGFNWSTQQLDEIVAKIKVR
jgi:hypothetical protein